jgi:hypothetical protein
MDDTQISVQMFLTINQYNKVQYSSGYCFDCKYTKIVSIFAADFLAADTFYLGHDVETPNKSRYNIITGLVEVHGMKNMQNEHTIRMLGNTLLEEGWSRCDEK